MHTTAWKYSADLSASQGTGYCYLAWQGRDIPCVTANGEVTLSLDNGSVDANTTFILTNLVYFNNASPSVSVKSYWKDENSNFVEVDRSNSFSFPYLTQNVIQAKKFKLVFHEGNPNYSTATYKTGSASAKYIAAFIEINTATFAAGTTADFSLNLPTNNTGLSDTTIYINSSGTNTL